LLVLKIKHTPHTKRAKEMPHNFKGVAIGRYGSLLPQTVRMVSWEESLVIKNLGSQRKPWSVCSRDTVNCSNESSLVREFPLLYSTWWSKKCPYFWLKPSDHVLASVCSSDVNTGGIPVCLDRFDETIRHTLLSEKLPHLYGDGGVQNGHIQVTGLFVFRIHSHGYVRILADHLLYRLVKWHNI
jgi:hypothetical protein